MKKKVKHCPKSNNAPKQTSPKTNNPPTNLSALNNNLTNFSNKPHLKSLPPTQSKIKKVKTFAAQT
jgi:hypothetical protein